jgi:hypothetical protein
MTQLLAELLTEAGRLASSMRLILSAHRWQAGISPLIGLLMVVVAWLVHRANTLQAPSFLVVMFLFLPTKVVSVYGMLERLLPSLSQLEPHA